jgi:hypothetical protein
MSFYFRRSKTVRGAVRGYILASLTLALVPLLLWADAPSWWAERGVLSSNAPDDYAAVNQGQVKNIATRAYAELNAKLPGGAGGDLFDLWNAPAVSTDDYRAINLGQLKNVAKPFYDRLYDAGYVGQPLATGQKYPWEGMTSTDDYALANIGQVKNLFSFELPSLPEVPANLVVNPTSATTAELTWIVSPSTAPIVQVSADSGVTWKTLAVLVAGSSQYTATDLDSSVSNSFRVLKSANGVISPQLADWMQSNGLDPATSSLDADSDGDGLSDHEESIRGTDPTDMDGDTDNDGVSDADDSWPTVSWITSPRLPDVRYAVVRLQSLGWPSTRSIKGFDSQGGVVGLDSSDGLLYYFRPGNDPATGGTVIPLPSSDSFYNVRVSRDGLVFGEEFIAEDPIYYKAQSWRPGDADATIYTPMESISGMNMHEMHTAIYCSAGGRTVVFESGRFHGGSGINAQLGSYSVPRLYMEGGITSLGQRLEIRVVGQNTTITGSGFVPFLINDDGLMAGEAYNQLDSDLSISDNGQLTSVPGMVIDLPNSTPRVFIGGEPMDPYDIDNSRVYWMHKQDGVWTKEDLLVWDTETHSRRYPWPALQANSRLEMISGELIRNGAFVPMASIAPNGWSTNIPAIRINDHGIILAEASRTLDDQGQPITSPQSEPVLLVPVEFTSEDRLVKGSITIPDGWTNVSLSLRSTAEGGQNLGTFSGLEPDVVNSPTYIYASEDDILSDAELNQQIAGTLDPRANTQAVVFYRDADNPRRLHFATAFDQLGQVELALSFGSSSTPAVAKLIHTLTAQVETAGLISTLDQRIETMEIPEVVDFDLDNDGDGIPDGSKSDLITASQPGTMAVPGAFVSEASEDDALNLVLLVNSDDDNADNVADSLNTVLDSADDDLARIVLRVPSSLSSPVGTLTLTHTGGPSLRLRFPTGPPVASGASVDLASPSGLLAGLATGAVTLYAEGLAPASNVAITLTYTPPTGAPVVDTVHLTVLDPSSLASLQTRHRYFTLRSDLGGLASRTYASNGAYHQNRLSLGPVGNYVPLQNRILLSKVLFPVIGGIKIRAAFIRGATDGFWLGLKGDRQALHDAGTAIGTALSIVTVESDADRIVRAIIIYRQIKELKKLLTVERVLVLTAYVGSGQMVKTITRDLYSDAEAALGWEPLTSGIDPQVLSYMSGIVVGFVVEQASVGVVSGAVLTRVVPVIRGIVTAVENGTRYTLEVLNDAAKAAVKLQNALIRIVSTEDEARAVAAAVQKARLIELPGGLKAPQVIDNWFRAKPQIYDDVLRIWADKLPANVSDQRLTHIVSDLASVLHRYGDAAALPDDAVKGFAHLQPKLFKTGDEAISRWKDCEKLFGGLDTSAKRNALKESLIAYKQAVELNPAAKFWIKNVDAIQLEAYRYSSFSPPNGWGSYDGLFPNLSDPWYCSFNKVNTPELANDLLLLPGNTRNPRFRFEFETQNINNKARLARGQGDIDPHYEPLTREVPLGANPHISAGTGVSGGGTQFFVEGEFSVTRVIDMVTNQQVWP